MGLDEIARETLAKHFFAFSRKEDPVERLPDRRNLSMETKRRISSFQSANHSLLQYSTQMNDYDSFKKYSKLVNDQREKAATLRGMFQFKRNRPAISIDEVEPEESILKRFATGAMSFGSISHEAHSTLAIAMNRIGGKSNTGEGGEDEIRYEPWKMATLCVQPLNRLLLQDLVLPAIISPGR